MGSAIPATIPSAATSQTGALGSIVWLDTPEGRRLVSCMGERGRKMLERWQASWEPQQDGAACAPASAMAALRVLGTQGNWNQSKIISEVVYPNHLFTSGVSLENGAEMIRILGANTLVVDVRCIADRRAAEEALREDLKLAFGPAEGGGDEIAPCLLANYPRWVGGDGGGHWSPLSGWASSESMVLIMDVNPRKCPPHWVPLGDLAEALCRWNHITNKPRGYVCVRRSTHVH